MKNIIKSSCWFTVLIIIMAISFVACDKEIITEKPEESIKLSSEENSKLAFSTLENAIGSSNNAPSLGNASPYTYCRYEVLFKFGQCPSNVKKNDIICVLCPSNMNYCPDFEILYDNNGKCRYLVRLLTAYCEPGATQCTHTRVWLNPEVFEVP